MSAGWIPAAIGAGTSLFGGSSAKKAGARAATVAWKRQKKAYKHRYQWQVEDMRKAGLNPMLSFDTGAGSVGSAPVNQEAGALGEGIAAASAKGLQNKQSQALIQNTTQNTAKQAAETRNIDAQWSNQLDQNILTAYDAHAATIRAREGDKATEADRRLTSDMRESLARTQATAQAARESYQRTKGLQADMPRRKLEGSQGGYLLDKATSAVGTFRRY